MQSDELQCKRARRTEANDADVLVSCPISGGDVEGNEFARYKKGCGHHGHTKRCDTEEITIGL